MKNWRVLQKVVLVGMVLILSLSLLAGCGGNESAPSEKTLVVAQGVDATMLDPGMHAETPTSNVERQIFDSLLERDTQMKFQPALATSWNFLNDTTWEIKLRQDVKFHDGKEMTAEDVKYTIERILDPEKMSPKASNLKAIKEVEILDPYTLNITTHEPYPILPARLSDVRVVPKHYVEEIGDDEFKLKPIGTGPYKLKEWIKDDHVTLAANQEYWRGAPEIAKVEFRPIPEDASRVMALQAGEVDIIVNVPPHQVKTIENSPDVHVADVPSTRIIFMPITIGKDGPMVNPKVRQALNYAVDVQSIIDNILQGNATEMTQALSAMDFGHNPNINAYGYDPEKAKQLLAEAGYPDGFKLTMQAPSGRYMMDKEVAEAVKAQLEAAGLEVELKLPEWGVYVDQIMTRSIEADIWLIGWSSSTFDADGTLPQWFRLGQRFCYYEIDEERNARMDELLDKASTTLDSEVREDYYHEALQMAHDDAAWITLYQQVDLYGVSDRVNWQPRSDESIVLYDASWK